MTSCIGLAAPFETEPTMPADHTVPTRFARGPNWHRTCAAYLGIMAVIVRRGRTIDGIPARVDGWE
uniref:Uncharacterized protein n=1 Tax=Candidatus Kentrum sp. TUN TaxID=2126343 RepID=A0A451AGD3_9GAMM|nr:MAG: hypothetical protein BECKTUN1418E_GA0071001_110114 [Candidatus Kentron sp. TUN]